MIHACGGKKLGFGREYIIPKPFDPRVLLWEAPAVAKAAMDSGVAREPIVDLGLDLDLDLDVPVLDTSSRASQWEWLHGGVGRPKRVARR